MIAGATCDKQQTSTATDLTHVFHDATEYHFVMLKVETTSHCIHDGFRLLKDLLLHERAVVAWKLDS